MDWNTPYHYEQGTILKIPSRTCSIAATSCDQLTLLRRRAHTTGSAAEGGTAALRLALVVLEDEERVGARLKLRAHQGLVGLCVAPRTHAILRHDILGVKVADGFIALAIATRILHEVVGEALRPGTKSSRTVVDHQNVGSEEDNEACDEEAETHDSSLFRDFFSRWRV